MAVSNIDAMIAMLITLAKIGAVPGDMEAEADLNESILDLIEGSSGDWDYGYNYADDAEFISYLKILQGLLKDIYVVVRAATIVGVTYAVASAIGTTAAVIDHGISSSKEQDLIIKAEEIRNDVVDNTVVELVDPKFSIEENARIIGEMGAVQAFSKLENCVSSNPSFAKKWKKWEE
jgi:hypothetical protein